MRGSERLYKRLVSSVAREVVRRRLTYLSYQKLRTLERHARKAGRRGIAGDFVEAGVALGGSGIVLAKAAGPDRTYHGYDVFGQIPAPSEDDDQDSRDRYAVIASGQSEGIGGDPYYGYVPDLRDRVSAALASFGIQTDRDAFLHEGDFEDILFPPGPVALAHIDCDWYDPVKLSLERLSAVLSPGGFIILDDFHDYDGCSRATNEFLAEHADMSVSADAGSLVLERRA